MIEWRGAGACKVVAGEMGAGIRARSAPLRRAARGRRWFVSGYNITKIMRV